jgi:hypothetical protein
MNGATAVVICRELGFSWGEPKTHPYGDITDETPYSSLLHNVQCTADDVRKNKGLWECEHTTRSSDDHGHSCTSSRAEKNECKFCQLTSVKCTNNVPEYPLQIFKNDKLSALGIPCL